MSRQRFAFDGNSEFFLNMLIAEQQIWPDPGACVFAATCAWSCAASRRWTAARWRAPCWGLTSKTPRPERSSWCFHRRPNKFHSSLYSSRQNAVNYQRICISLETKSTSKTRWKQETAGWIRIQAWGSPRNTDGWWISVLLQKSLTLTGNVGLASSVPSIDISWI